MRCHFTTENISGDSDKHTTMLCATVVTRSVSSMDFDIVKKQSFIGDSFC